MNVLNPAISRDPVSFSSAELPELPNEILQKIFYNLNIFELKKIRRVSLNWNDNALDNLSRRKIRKKEKLDNYLNFLSFLKDNLTTYPNETAKISNDLKTLEKKFQRHNSIIIPFFKALSSYNLESRIADTLQNIRILDLRALYKLSQNKIAPECKNMLTLTGALQEFNYRVSPSYGSPIPIMKGMNDNEMFYYAEDLHEAYLKALTINRYDLAIKVANFFTLLPIHESQKCPDSFVACWSAATIILESDKVSEPFEYPEIPYVEDENYFQRSAKIYKNAAKKNKLKRLTRALKESNATFAALFAIRFLKAIGKNDAASQIELLLNPRPFQFTESTNFSDFWINIEDESQLGKRERENFSQPSAKKTNI